MRHHQYWSYILVVLGVFLHPASFAQNWDIGTESQWKSVTGGALAGIALHELGHIGLAEILDREVDYDGVTIFYPDENLSDQDRARLASAGVQVQWLISESLLRKSEEQKTSLSSFRAGLVLSQILVSAAYLTILYDHDDGDVTGIHEATGWSRGKIAAALAIPAALDTWRLIGLDVPRWVPNISLLSKGLGLTAIWTF
ncbi:MAG: hypothetical protein ACI8P9_002324 [Parasphingorhabdus sp.]|jgi:hypothetical protein